MIPVSILMSSFNRAHLLEKGLDSIFIQNYTPLEVLVIDDGSTDNTKEICAKYPVTYIYQENTGQAKAMNLAFRLAKHPIVVWQSPEVCHREMHTIARLVDAVKNDDEIWAMATIYRQTDLDSSSVYILCSPDKQARSAFFLCALWNKWLLKIHGLDEDYIHPWYNDNDIADRLIDYCGLTQVFLEDITGLHLWHPSPVKDDVVGIQSSCSLYNNKTVGMSLGIISPVRNLSSPEWLEYEQRNPQTSTS